MGRKPLPPDEKTASLARRRASKTKWEAAKRAKVALTDSRRPKRCNKATISELWAQALAKMNPRIKKSWWGGGNTIFHFLLRSSFVCPIAVKGCRVAQRVSVLPERLGKRFRRSTQTAIFVIFGPFARPLRLTAVFGVHTNFYEHTDDFFVE